MTRRTRAQNTRWRSLKDQLVADADPLDGIANLFDVAIVFALGILIATLAGPLQSSVMNVDAPKIDPQERTTVSQGKGTFLGKAYRLENGSVIYVPDAK